MLSLGLGLMDARPQSALDLYAVMPTVTGSLLWLSSGKSVFSDAGGTTPTAVDGTIARWDPVSAAWGLGTYSFRQSTAGDRPALKSNGVQSASNDHMILDSGTISLTGDFTVWLAYLLNDLATETVIPISRNTGAANYFDSFQVNNAGNGAYAMAESTFSQWLQADNGTAGLRITRFRRSGTTVYMKTYGEAAETTMGGLDGNTVTLNALLRRGGNFVANSSSTARLREVVIASASYDEASASNIAVIAKLQELVPGVLW